MARPSPGAGRHPVEVAHRPAVAGCPRPVRALADLLWPAAALADRWDLAEGVGAAGRWRRAGLRRRSRWPARPGAAGGGASGSVGRGLDGGAATTTTPAPAAPSAVSTPPARPAADAPPRSRPVPGPTLEVVALLRGQPPPLPARAVGAAWARTAARNAWATRTRVLGRAGARCWSFDRSVSPARPPNRTCDFHRIRLSTGSRRGSASGCRVVVHGVGMRVPR
jgi:hypothetical protein